MRPSSCEPSKTRTLGSRWCRCHQHQLRWSYLEAPLQWGSGPKNLTVWVDPRKKVQPFSTCSYQVGIPIPSLKFNHSAGKERITVPSSLVVIVPSPSLSNREKASLNSAICSSVSWSAIAKSHGLRMLCFCRASFEPNLSLQESKPFWTKSWLCHNIGRNHSWLLTVYLGVLLASRCHFLTSFHHLVAVYPCGCSLIHLKAAAISRNFATSGIGDGSRWQWLIRVHYVHGTHIILTCITYLFVGKASGHQHLIIIQWRMIFRLYTISKRVK